MNRKKETSDKPTFEEALEELKGIVFELENGKLTLSQSMERYELGVKRLNECYKALNEAQVRIEQLVKLDEDGRLITKPFDASASIDLDSKKNRGSGQREKSPPSRKSKKLVDEDAVDDNDADDADSTSLF